jgi:tape measure domain-containing protein
MASLEVGTMLFNVRANSSKLQGDLNQAKGMLQSVSSQINGGMGGAMKGLQSMFSGGGAIGSALLGGIGGVAAMAVGKLTAMLKQAAAEVVNLSSEAQQAGVAFEVMLGSRESSAAMLNKIKDFAKATPFGSADLQDAARTMLSFGMNAESIMPNLRRLGDVAGGNGQKLKSLALVFGQIQAAGKLTGGDLLQLINVGFNPLQIISEKTGKSMGELRKEMEAGGISAQMVTDAFTSATGQGGRFFGMMEKMSKTFGGQWSTLMDNLSELGRRLGNALLPGLTKMVGQLNEGIDIYLAFMDRLREGIAPVAADIERMLKPIVQPISDMASQLGKYLTSLVDFRTPAPDTKPWDDYVEKINATNRALEELDKSQVAAMQKQREALQKRADELTQTMRTPMEKAAEQMREFQGLANQGFLPPETMERLTGKLMEDLDRATAKAKEFREAMTPEVGAADVNTSAGQAMQATFNANISKLESAEQAKLEEQRRTNQLLRDLKEEMKRQKPLNVKKVSGL